jgi:hypothetical protein
VNPEQIIREAKVFLVGGLIEKISCGIVASVFEKVKRQYNKSARQIAMHSAASARTANADAPDSTTKGFKNEVN